VQKQQHRIRAILAANRDPLLNAADGDEAGLINALWRPNRKPLRIAGAQKRNQSVELAIFRIKRDRLLRILIELAECRDC
jgi:hypothetical protein